MPGHSYALLGPVHGLLQVACRSKRSVEKAKRRALRMAEPCPKDRFNNSEKHDSLRDKYRKKYITVFSGS